jgi:Protein of unknown function (DUF4064)
MRTSAMVLGIIGGVLGLVAALLAITIGGIGQALNAAGAEASGAGTVTGLGLMAFFVAVAAIVGGALAKSSPTASWILLLATGIIGFICISVFWILSGILLLVAAVLEFLARKPKTLVPQMAAAAPAPWQAAGVGQQPVQHWAATSTVPAAQPVVASRFCPSCGAASSTGGQFCSSCGLPVEPDLGSV